jgi:ATP-dependent RNA helicase SUPV3L1/SUV3
MRNELSWQEELRKLLNCDLKELFPIARELDRELHFYVGPTNSGKTYQAMQSLMEADCGVYLAPLRLLALENYQYLLENGLLASLITGEEERIDEEASFISSTIEMVNYSLEVDVAVIDEVQMLGDPDRGWAWVNAIVGVPAKKVIMTGSVNALDAVKKIAEYLGEKLLVKKFKRKAPLKFLPNQIPLKHLPKHTALIAFSRADVLQLKSKLSKNYKISVIYGNLSPEVREEEARRFREGESDIVIATDAIAMGLNLPIETILFTTDNKFDGEEQRLLTPNEVTQISGRAGRYGKHESGYVGATKRAVYESIKKIYHSPLKTIKPPFKVKATTSQILDLSNHLKTDSLYKILKFYSKNMNFSGPFIAANISYMLELAKLLDKKRELSLEEKYILSGAPVTTKSPLIKKAFFEYIEAIIKKEPISYKPSIKLKGMAKSELELLKAEDELKKISLYMWLGYKMPSIFIDTDKAESARTKVNRYCQISLKSSKLLKRGTKKRYQKSSKSDGKNKKSYKGYRNRSRKR